jgi:hypothetical protein
MEYKQLSSSIEEESADIILVALSICFGQKMSVHSVLELLAQKADKWEKYQTK